LEPIGKQRQKRRAARLRWLASKVSSHGATVTPNGRFGHVSRLSNGSRFLKQCLKCINSVLDAFTVVPQRNESREKVSLGENEMWKDLVEAFSHGA
jgi:hypothetical protein